MGEEESNPTQGQRLQRLLESKTAEYFDKLPYAEEIREKSTVSLQWVLNREYLDAGAASAFACCLTHPLDLLKVRFQLQGELRPPGTYPVKYRTIPQALLDIRAAEGVRGWYKAFAPGFIYQFVMNTVRMLVFEKCNRAGITSDIHEEPVLWRYLATCVISGSAGAVIASPLYLAKVQTQSQVCPKLAVGWQHPHPKSRWVVWNAFRGHRGYLRSGFQGGTSAVMRVSVASSVQVLCFTTLQHGVYSLGVHNPLLNSSISGVISALPVVIISNPLDVLCTRMYNQELGAYYKTTRECAEKLLQREGWRGFYKGAVVNYCRTAPHMVVTLLFWDLFKRNGIELQQIDQTLNYFDNNKINNAHKLIISKFES